MRILNDEQRQQVTEALKAGESRTSISARFGISRSSVGHYEEKLRDGFLPVTPAWNLNKCDVCPMLFFNRLPKRYCTEECRIRSFDIAQREKFAEFEWIALTDSWDNVAVRFGYTSVKQLREWLRKNGHDSWAERINTDTLPMRRDQRAA